VTAPAHHGRIGVAFLIRSLNRGGAERQLATLAGGLDPEAFDVTVLTFYPGGPVWDELQQCPSVRLRSLSKTGRWDVLGFSRRLRTALKQVRPHILHCYMTEPSIFGLLVGRVTRIPAIVWGIRASNMDLAAYGAVHEVSFKLMAGLSRFADLIIGNSESGRRHHLQRGFSPRAFVTIPNGIDTDRFRPSAAHRRAARAAWGIKEDDIVVGVAARLDPMKGYPVLLRAAAGVLRQCPRVRFVCLGGGPAAYQTEFRQMAEALGIGACVLWLGECGDMPSLYPGFDIACSSSVFGEGFSNSIAEAMACAIPCVVTDVGDSGRIVGDTGLVVPPADPDALTEAILALVRSGAEARGALGRRARARIVSSFGVRIMIERTSACYRMLIPDPGVVQTSRWRS